MRKAHAEHNEKLCDLLRKNGEFNDWVITTAFYSAVNLVKHEIFPIKEKNESYIDFEDYYFGLPETTRPNKHQALINLVKRKLSAASIFYKKLFDDCNIARYHDFHVTEEQAKTARTMLSKLNGVCKKA